MEGGSASQVENHDENTNNDTNNDAGTVESSAQSTQTPSTIRFDIAAFTVTFPPAPLPDDLLSDHDEDEEGQEPKLSVSIYGIAFSNKTFSLMLNIIKL